MERMTSPGRPDSDLAAKRAGARDGWRCDAPTDPPKIYDERASSSMAYRMDDKKSGKGTFIKPSRNSEQ